MDLLDELETTREEGFSLLGLKQPIIEALKKAGIYTPSPIQQEVIPLILQGADVIGHAQTGTGKTAAFALPALHNLQQTGSVEVLVITPTRELASQVSEEFSRFGHLLKARIATVYGGKSFTNQIDAIRKGASIVVATPGRLLDLLQGGKMGFFAPSLVIIDEADEMMDMGFLEDLQAIFEHLPPERQTLMFSATMPPAIQALAQRTLRNPHLIKAAQKQATNEDITQYYCVLQDHERDEAVIRLLEAHDMQKAILFCRTKKDVDRLTHVLSQRGLGARGLHGDMEQAQREQVTQAFRYGKTRILIATDVAARGLNIVDISHVINYHLPFDAENYVHRIGRTGRAGRKGSSITFVTPKEHGRLLQFQRMTKGKLDQMTIPSKQQIRQAQAERLLSSLKNQSPASDIASFLSLAREEMDLNALAAKLFHWVLSQKPIEGPETIGVLEPVTSFRNTDRNTERSPRRFGPAKHHHARREPSREPDRFGNYPKKKFAPKKPKRPEGRFRSF